jgi:hypothetical protein
MIFNFVVLLFFGNYLLRAILFPYANYFIKKKLNSQINRRFAKEFARMILIMDKIIKVLAEIDTMESYDDQRQQEEGKSNH